MPVDEPKSKDVPWHELEPSQFIDVDDDVIAVNMRFSHDNGPEHSMVSVDAIARSRAVCFDEDNKVPHGVCRERERDPWGQRVSCTLRAGEETHAHSNVGKQCKRNPPTKRTHPPKHNRQHTKRGDGR